MSDAYRHFDATEVEIARIKEEEATKREISKMKADAATDCRDKLATFFSYDGVIAVGGISLLVFLGTMAVCTIMYVNHALR